jgi:Phage major capsid protein E
MELSLDIFRNDAFSFAALQRVVKNVPFVPTMLGSLELFEPKPLTGTDKIIIYEEDGAFRMIPYTPRGAADIQQARNQGRMFAMETLRLAKMDTLRASELLNVSNMALPENVRMRNAMTLLDQRVEILKNDMAGTKEFARLCGLRGRTLNADGTTVMRDYFDDFGVTPPTTVAVNFATIYADDALQFFQKTFLVPLQLALKDRWVQGVTSVGALVGDSYWDKLMTHPAIREIYKLEYQAQVIARATSPLVQPNNWREFEFAGIRFINYRGSTNGEISVATNQALFFPVKARDVFNVYWAPGETLQQVQNEGQPEYLMIQPDVRDQMVSHVDVYLRSYPLYACIFPKALMISQHA